eukprot:6204124-Pleurochrysis_carterae.AAC.2
MAAAAAARSFVAVDDAVAAGASIVLQNIRLLDGSRCNQTSTPVGVAPLEGDSCVDFGVSNAVDGQWPHLEYLPSASILRSGPSVFAAGLAARLHRLLEASQFGKEGGVDSVLNIDLMPLIGFGQVVEVAVMYLAHAAHTQQQVSFAADTIPEWSSEWLCDGIHSIHCYFNLSGRPGSIERLSKLPLVPEGRGGLRRRMKAKARLIGLPGWNHFGAIWVSAQLSRYLFERMQPRVRQEVDLRRRLLFPSGVPAGTIGLHIRKGDSCVLRSRFCASNLTRYFAEAVRIGERYSATRLFVATDDAAAAAMCASKPLGMHCVTANMERARFAAQTSIELRVAEHARGGRDDGLSGNARRPRTAPYPTSICAYTHGWLFQHRTLSVIECCLWSPLEGHRHRFEKRADSLMVGVVAICHKLKNWCLAPARLLYLCFCCQAQQWLSTPWPTSTCLQSVCD